MLNSWFRSLTRSRQIPVPIHIPARKSGVASHRIASLIETLADCPELLVPLTLRPDLPVQPAVHGGDRVEPFDALSQPGNDQAIRAFSPAAAVVADLATADTEYACELPAVRLRLSAPAVGAAQMPAPNLHELLTSLPKPGESRAQARDLRSILADLARIEDLPAALDELGVMTTYEGRAEPMGGLLRRAAGRTNLLVINAIQSEPRLGSHLRLTLDATGAIVAGTKALMTYLGLRRATLLIGTTRSLRQALVRRLRRFGIRALPVRTSFPGSDNSIVLRQVFHRSSHGVDAGSRTDSLVLPADTVWRTGLALMHGKPVPFQPVTIAGDCLPPASQQVYFLPIGLTISGLIRCLMRRDLLPREPKVVLLGGPMTGTAIVDPSRTVITQSTQAVLLMSRRPRLQTTGCIRCGWCIYGCPAGIDPIAILNALEAGQRPNLARLGTRRCIDCGVCSAVCPSHLPLAQAARTARTLQARSNNADRK